MDQRIMFIHLLVVSSISLAYSSNYTCMAFACRYFNFMLCSLSDPNFRRRSGSRFGLQSCVRKHKSFGSNSKDFRQCHWHGTITQCGWFERHQRVGFLPVNATVSKVNCYRDDLRPRCLPSHFRPLRIFRHFLPSLLLTLFSVRNREKRPAQKKLKDKVDLVASKLARASRFPWRAQVTTAVNFSGLSLSNDLDYCDYRWVV